MKPVGEWVESCGGCGPSALRRSPSIAFSQAADRTSGPGVGGGLCRIPGARRLEHLSSVYPRSAPNLLIALAAALSGDGSGGEKRGSRIPAHHRNHLAGLFAATRSSPATTDQRTRISGGPGKIGSADGSHLSTALSLTAESPFGQPSVTGAAGSIPVLELSRSGSDELASRTGHPADGGDPQSLGRESNLARSAHAKHSQTCRQQLRSASSILQKLICASHPKPLDLTVPRR